jgi:hypothetical protein
MKCVAHVGETHALVEVSVEELSKIQGFNSVYDWAQEKGLNSYGCDRSIQRLLPVGRTVEVSKLWQIIYSERMRPEEIERCARTMRSLADMLQTTNATLAACVPKDPAPEEPQLEALK